MKRTGFTLIELLVVIAVIVVLVALLFPVFVNARERARVTACLSNLRQVGAGLQMYVDAYDEAYPSAFSTQEWAQKNGPEHWRDTVHNDGMWKRQLRPYLSSKEVFLCASNPIGWGDFQDYWGHKPQFYDHPSRSRRYPLSYGMNQSVYRPVDPRNVTTGKAFDLYDYLTPSDFADTSSIIGIGEVKTRKDYDEINLAMFQFGLHQDTGLIEGGIFHHHKRTNYLFLDGHARSLTAVQTLTPKEMWGRDYTFYPTLISQGAMPASLIESRILPEYR